MTNDFWVNLLDMGTQWKPTSDAPELVRGMLPYQGRRPMDLQPRRSRLQIELGAPRAHGGLRDDAKDKFVPDFVAVWDKVMNLNRFDRG